MLEDEKQNRGISKKFSDKWSTREVIDILNSRLYREVAAGSRKRHDISSMW